MLVGSQCLAQTPTPIQPRKPVQTQVNNIPNQTQAAPNTGIPDYCSNSFSVFRGILKSTDLPIRNNLSYVQFKFPRCFSDEKSAYASTRIILKETTPGEVNRLLNKPVKLVMFKFELIRVGANFELVAVEYAIKEDDE